MGCVCAKEDLLVDGHKYTIINKIADGGFGVISLVENSRTYEQYALKRVKAESKKEMEQMSLENEYYKQLNSHPNLIKLVADSIREDQIAETYFIYSIFPYYSHGTLQDEIDSNLKSNRSIQPSRLIQLFHGICDGTNFIHEANLAHRDLKPHNVLLSDDRQSPILTDYGSMTKRTMEVANLRKCQEIQEWAAENCSMFYRAPELFEPQPGSTINEKADNWSLGCVLYTMLFNKGPFDYVCEKGDSIALAVANANFKIGTIQEASDWSNELVDLIKSMINVEQFSREDLISVMNKLKELSRSAVDMDIV